MVSIKNFDYFRKTDQTKNTRTGGTVSLLSLIVRFLVLILTVLVFFSLFWSWSTLSSYSSLHRLWRKTFLFRVISTRSLKLICKCQLSSLKLHAQVSNFNTNVLMLLYSYWHVDCYWVYNIDAQRSWERFWIQANKRQNRWNTRSSRWWLWTDK